MYSLVIPAHNEAKNLPKLLWVAVPILKKLGKFEIIIVNDNSTDNSKEVLEGLQKKIPQLRFIHRTKKPGVGFAKREGLAAVKGDVIITMDGDLSHDPKEIPKFLPHLEKYDMICGSRYISGGRADMSVSRVMISGLFNIIFRTLLGIPIKDFTSGYRVYKTSAIKKFKLKSKTFGVYIEIPIKAHLTGSKLTEIPISYHKREYGTSNLNYFKQGPEYLKVACSAIIQKLRNQL